MSFENTFDKLNDEFPVDLSEKVSELQAEIESLKAQVNNELKSELDNLRKANAELKAKNSTLDNQLHELYHAMELISKIATVAPVDTAILEVINCYRTGELLQAHNLEQHNSAIIDFIDFCIEKENIDRSIMEVAFLHWMRAKALKESK